MTEPIDVRTVVASDREELLRMRILLWPDSTAEEVDSLIESPPDPCAVFVATGATGRLCGFAEVGLRPFAEGCTGQPVGYLEGIWVDSAERRSGIGRRLVEAGNQWVAARGCSEFASDCEPDNPASRAFHSALGFGEVGQIVCFRRPLQLREA